MTHDVSPLKDLEKYPVINSDFFYCCSYMIKGVGVSGEQSCVVNSEEHGQIIHSLALSLSVMLADYTPQKSIYNLKEIPAASSVLKGRV